MFVPRIAKPDNRGNNLSSMKTKLKHVFFLASLVFAATACGSGMAKPTSGLDVSALSPRLLSISPTVSDSNEKPLGTGEAKRSTLNNNETNQPTAVN